MSSDLKIEYLKVDKLVFYKNNSRTHSIEQINQIVASIKEFGFTNPILIDESNGVIAGHGRLMACKEMGIKTAPCVKLKGLSESQKKAYVIADNALALNAEWDIEMLKIELDVLDDFDIDVLGLDFEKLDIDFESEQEGLTDDDSVPDVEENSISKNGDIWLLGEHRVMCGDSTNADDVKSLMCGERADITFTSPPYNVNITITDGKHALKYQDNQDNQDNQDYIDFLNKFTMNALAVSDYVFTNIQSLANNKVALIEHLFFMRENFSDTVVWDKGSAEPAMARKVLNSQFEYVHIFSHKDKKTKKTNRAIGNKDFRGTLSNVVEIGSSKDKQYAKIHRATFPVEFAQFFVDNFTNKSCYDPFGGTGTTLIACEKSGRKNFTMELEEKYCDVIIKRWQEYTGKQATHAKTGDFFNKRDKNG